jgi:hypothetical protein
VHVGAETARVEAPKAWIGSMLFSNSESGCRLTQAGTRLVDRLLPQLIRLESSLAAGMTKRQVSDLTRLLDEFARILQRSHPNRAGRDVPQPDAGEQSSCCGVRADDVSIASAAPRKYVSRR